MRSFQLDGEVAQTLKELAEYEQRSVDDMASELLSSAIDQRYKAKGSLHHWRSLSPREQQVVALNCLGYTNRQIAASLSISPETVKTHLQNAVIKFGVQSKDDFRQILDGWDFSGWDIPPSG